MGLLSYQSKAPALHHYHQTPLSGPIYLLEAQTSEATPRDRYGTILIYQLSCHTWLLLLGKGGKQKNCNRGSEDSGRKSKGDTLIQNQEMHPKSTSPIPTSGHDKETNVLVSWGTLGIGTIRATLIQHRTNMFACMFMACNILPFFLCL